MTGPDTILSCRDQAVGVTGANGFVGSEVIRWLVANGYPAVAFARQAMSLPQPAVWRQLSDLGGAHPPIDQFNDLRSLVHCAARVHVMRDRAADPLDAFREINCRGTIRIAQSAAAAGVQHFVFVSTIKVMGEETGDRPFQPNDTPRPQDPYGISKAEAEDGLTRLAIETGMKVTIVRPVLVYGPGVRANFAALAKVARSGLPLPLGNLNNKRSLVFVENLADLLGRISVGKLPGGRIYLPSDGPPVSTRHLICEMACAQGREARFFPIPWSLASLGAKLTKQGHVFRRLFGNLEVDREHLDAVGWSPPFDLRQGLARTFAEPR